MSNKLSDYNHFVVSYLAIIDGSQTELGTIGSSSSQKGDYMPNTIKKVIDRHYRKEYPFAKQIAITFTEIKGVSIEEYAESSKSFTPLG